MGRRWNRHDLQDQRGRHVVVKMWDGMGRKRESRRKSRPQLCYLTQNTAFRDIGSMWKSGKWYPCTGLKEREYTSPSQQKEAFLLFCPCWASINEALEKNGSILIWIKENRTEIKSKQHHHRADPQDLLWKSNHFSPKDIYKNKFYSEIKYCDHL